MQQPFDRAAEDLGNSIHLEHVNVTIPDQRLATLFYVAGLGLTRDPYLMVSDTNMWVNVGRSQFHLPNGTPQVLRGHTGLVISGRAALLERLAAVAKKLDGTSFAFSEHNDYVEAVCPWGNRLRCYEPDAARFGRITLGIPYVEFDVPTGTAPAISCRSTSRIFPALTANCWIAIWSRRKTTSTSTAFATSSISQAANICSPSSTRCAAPRIRCTCAP